MMSVKTLAPILIKRAPRPTLGAINFCALSALILTFIYNQPLISTIHANIPRGSGLLETKIVLLLGLINFLLVSLFSQRRILKPVLLLLLLVSAGVLYFSNSYGTIIDRHMIENVWETDSKEASGLLNVGLFSYLFIFGLLPAWVIMRMPISWLAGKRDLIRYILQLLLTLLAITVLLFSSYQDFASFFRNHRVIKNMATPLNVIAAVGGFASHKLHATQLGPFNPVGQDAVLTPSAQPHKPTLLVLVIGETARADHFGINGYQRNTTPYLAAANIVNFPKATSCGTATAVSVPCMLSWMDRAHYKEGPAKNSNNLLDILKIAGVKVTWEDNNSGCKDMCNRVPHQQYPDPKFPSDNCHNKACYDDVLLDNLRRNVSRNGLHDQVIVLHQVGSHGPEYYQRSQPGNKKFTPECKTGELQLCQSQDIINAYDNTIVETDHFLGSVIQHLVQYSGKYDTAMIYLSDHGESLGENNIYLHGLPYWIAPEAQKHIPFVIWLAPQTYQDKALNQTCLQNRSQSPVSQDSLFHSVLSLMNVSTKIYQSKLDVFANCYH